MPSFHGLGSPLALQLVLLRSIPLKQILRCIVCVHLNSGQHLDFQLFLSTLLCTHVECSLLLHYSFLLFISVIIYVFISVIIYVQIHRISKFFAIIIKIQDFIFRSLSLVELIWPNKPPL